MYYFCKNAVKHCSNKDSDNFEYLTLTLTLRLVQMENMLYTLQALYLGTFLACQSQAEPVKN